MVKDGWVVAGIVVGVAWLAAWVMDAPGWVVPIYALLMAPKR